MLIFHSCDWGNLGKELQMKYVPQSGKEKEKVARWIGYGYPIIEKSLFCEDNRVTLVDMALYHRIIMWNSDSLCLIVCRRNI